MDFADVDQLETALARRARTSPTAGLAVSVYLALDACAARCCSRASRASARPRSRGRSRGVARRRADPPAVLRGHRRRPGAVRVGLLAPAAVRAHAPGRRARPRRAGPPSSTGPSSWSSGRCCARCAPGAGAVLLIDELDRADEEFEAFLLEVLADSAVTIPEIGTVTRRRAAGRWCSPPTAPASCTTRSSAAACTTGSTTPSLEREVAIIRLRAPEASRGARRARWPRWSARLRELDLAKRPGPAEAIDWARALAALGVGRSTPTSADETLGWAHQEPRRPGAGAPRPPRACIWRLAPGDLGPAMAPRARRCARAGVPVGTGRVISMARAGRGRVGPRTSTGRRARR